MIPFNFSNTPTYACLILPPIQCFAEFQKRLKAFLQTTELLLCDRRMVYSSSWLPFPLPPLQIPKQFSLEQPSNRRLPPDPKSYTSFPMPVLRERTWEAEGNYRNVTSKLPLSYLAFTGQGGLS